MGQMTDKFALRPAVAFAEWMQRVHLAKIMRGAVAERAGVESGKVVFLRKLFEDRRGGAANMGVMGEQIAAFADVDGTQLPGPGVQIAKQVAMNGL